MQVNHAVLSEHVTLFKPALPRSNLYSDPATTLLLLNSGGCVPRVLRVLELLRQCPRKFLSIRLDKDEVLSLLHDLVALLMQQPVMIPAQTDQVIERSLAPVAPVLDVVGVHVTVLGAAREAAALIPEPQRPAHSGWNGAGLAPHV